MNHDAEIVLNPFDFMAAQIRPRAAVAVDTLPRSSGWVDHCRPYPTLPRTSEPRRRIHSRVPAALAE
jgi:hypothetical protein